MVDEYEREGGRAMSIQHTYVKNASWVSGEVQRRRSRASFRGLCIWRNGVCLRRGRVGVKIAYAYECAKRVGRDRSSAGEREREVDMEG